MDTVHFGDKIFIAAYNDPSSPTLPFSSNPSLGVLKNSTNPLNKGAGLATDGFQYLFELVDPTSPSSKGKVSLGSVVNLKLLANQNGQTFPDLFLTVPLNPTSPQGQNMSAVFATSAVLQPQVDDQGRTIPAKGTFSIKFANSNDASDTATVSTVKNVSIVPGLYYWETDYFNYLTTSSTAGAGDKSVVLKEWTITKKDQSSGGGGDGNKSQPLSPLIWIGIGVGGLIFLLMVAIILKKRRSQ